MYPHPSSTKRAQVHLPTITWSEPTGANVRQPLSTKLAHAHLPIITRSEDIVKITKWNDGKN